MIEVHLPPAVERLPRHRARLEAACRTAMAQPDIVEMTTSDELTAPLLERHGVEPASRARAAVRAALDLGLAWRPPAPGSLG